MVIKRTLSLTILLLVLVISAAAQEKRLNSSPQNFRSFFSGFLNAVQKSEKAKVADMTKFPFKYGFDAGDEGKMTRAQFLRRFSEVFGKSPRKFMSEKYPVFSREGNNYYISTEYAEHLMFVKSGNTFKFVSYMVEP